MKTTPPVLSWLITGCSSGFGRHVALEAARKGHQVIATARDSTSIADLEAAFPANIACKSLDVTSAASRHDAVRFALERHGRVDVLMNNAGYGYYAAIEEGEEIAIRTLFETHFFGAVALIQDVLPGMRDRASGMIINLSSVGGVIGYPGTGFYCATKFAIEGLSEALKREIEPLGLSVMVVEPGAFQTNFIGSSRKVSGIEIEDYAQTAGVFRHRSSDRKLPGDPARAASLIVEAVQSGNPPFRLVLGQQAHKQIMAHLRDRLAAYGETQDRAALADYPS